MSNARGAVQDQGGVAELRKLDIHFPGEEGWLDAAEVRALTPAALVGRVKALQPHIAAHAEATERARRPIEPVWSALRQTGAFYHFVPKRFGGLEFGLDTFIDAMLPIGEVCASTCWVASFTVEHNFLAALFPEEGQKEMFAKGRYIVAPGVSNPVGLARRVPGGYKVSGHYKWGSAVMNADWVLVMAIIEGSSPPAPTWFALPATEVTVLDAWYVDGMAGTGSNDILLKDVFVPDHLSLAGEGLRSGSSPGAALHDSPLYRMPAIPLLSLATSIPTIASARGAVALYRARLNAGRTTFSSQIKQADKASTQVRLAEADMLAHASELVLRDAAQTLATLGLNGDGGNKPARIRLITQFAQATKLARAAVTKVMEGSGAGAHILTNPLQRIFRDVNVATAHLLHDYDTNAEQHGRQLLNMDPTSNTY